MKDVAVLRKIIREKRRVGVIYFERHPVKKFKRGHDYKTLDLDEYQRVDSAPYKGYIR
jgi:hypothetical protein